MQRVPLVPRPHPTEHAEVFEPFLGFISIIVAVRAVVFPKPAGRVLMGPTLY